MKSKWRYIFVISALMLVIVLSAAALVSTGNNEAKVQISVIVENSAESRWVPLQAGLSQAADDNNVRLNIVSTNEFHSLAEERELIEKEIQGGADGIITQLYSSSDTAEMKSEFSRQVALELIDTDADADVDVEGKYASVMPDDVSIGRAIGNELLINYNENLKGKKIGILCGNQKQYSMQKRMQGFTQSIQNAGCRTVWVEDGSGAVQRRLSYRQTGTHADIIVALDNNGLEQAVDYIADSEDKVALYGEGCSDKNVYYLDKGIIKSMIVPDEYNMGYQSVTAVADRLKNKLVPMKNVTIGYRIVHKDNMYDPDNQKLLFPIIQ